jgi:hypothetical protein
MLFFVFSKIQTESEKPFIFLQTIGFTNVLIYVILSFSYRYVMESFGYFESVQKLINFNNQNPPVSLGDSFSTKDQLSFLIFEGYTNVQKMSEIFRFKIGEKSF